MNHRTGNTASGTTLINTGTNWTGRPWYIKANATKSGSWTDPYKFVSGEMGITYSKPVFDNNKNVVAVVAVDIVLDRSVELFFRQTNCDIVVFSIFSELQKNWLQTIYHLKELNFFLTQMEMSWLHHSELSL